MTTKRNALVDSNSVAAADHPVPSEPAAAGDPPARAMADPMASALAPVTVNRGPESETLPAHETASIDPMSVVLAAPWVLPMGGTTHENLATLELSQGDLMGDRFEIIELLGKGAFGAVYRARDRIAHEDVALKVLRSRKRVLPDSDHRVRSELRAARKVSHPGVVRIHDVVDFHQTLALSMEFVEGETLQARLDRKQQLNETEIRTLAIALTQSLMAAHRAGVVHCDLKPANIILRAGSDQPVITDFGTSHLSLDETGEHPAANPPETRAAPRGATAGASLSLPLAADEETPLASAGITVSTSTLPGMTHKKRRIRGTPAYAAPEIFTTHPPEQAYTPAVDIYALGVVLFQCATGTWPHRDAKEAVAFVRARSTTPAPPLGPLRPDLSADLCQLIDRCLDPEPQRRCDGMTLFDGLLRRPQAPRPWRPVLIALLTVVLTGAAIWTWLSGLPLGARRLSVEVVNRGDPDDAWMARATERMAVHEWLQRKPHIPIGARITDANVIARLSLSRVDKMAVLDIHVKRHGGRLRSLGQVQARSIAEAIEQALVVLEKELDPSPPTEPPVAEGDRTPLDLGSVSPPAQRLYDDALDAYFGSILVELEPIQKRLMDAIQLDPGWAHPRALLVLAQGRTTPAARATLVQAATELGASKRDPLGRVLLSVLDLMAHKDRLDEALRRLQSAPPESRSDVLFLNVRGDLGHLQQRSTDLVSIYQQLHDLRPDLQFGLDLAAALYRARRGDEVAPMLKRWFDEAPQSEVALVSQIALDSEAGRHDAAQRLAEDLLFLHGPVPHRLLTLCDALLVARRTREARSVLSRLGTGDRRMYTFGQHRLGIIAILEGQFAQGHDLLASTLAEQRTLGSESEIVQTLQALSSLDLMLGDRDDAAAHLDELERTLNTFGAASRASVVRSEHLLVTRRKRCPSREALFQGLSNGQDHVLVERNILRAAAVAGCVPCTDALRKGLSSEERSTRSLFQFGQCAERTGDLPLAIDAFKRAGVFLASSMNSGNAFSPELAVLSHLHLGRLHERQGHSVEALEQYQRFLTWWDHADRTLDAIDEARRAVKRLRKD